MKEFTKCTLFIIYSALGGLCTIAMYEQWTMVMGVSLWIMMVLGMFFWACWVSITRKNFPDKKY